MKPEYSVETTEENQRRIKITIPHDAYQNRYQRILSQAAGRAKIKGFRPGRAPKEVVAKLYGQTIQRDVVYELIDETYRDAVKQHELRVVGFPQVELDTIEQNKDLSATALVELYPEPTIENYFGLELEVEVEQFQEEHLERGLKGIQERFAKNEPIQGRTTAAIGDLATIDYSATIDGAAFSGSEGKDATVELGSKQLPADFEEGLLGLEVGAEKTITVSFPTDLSQNEIAGKVAEYRVVLKKLEQKVLPELTAEFIKEQLKFESSDDLHRHLRESIERSISDANKQGREEKYFDRLAEKNAFRIPQVLIDEEIRNIFFEGGYLNPQKEESYKMDMTPFREGFQERARKRVERSILLRQIIKQEKVVISDEEMDLWLVDKATEMKTEKSKLESMFGVKKSSENLKNVIAKERMTGMLLEKAKIKERALEKE